MCREGQASTARAACCVLAHVGDGEAASSETPTPACRGHACTTLRSSDWSPILGSKPAAAPARPGGAARTDRDRGPLKPASRQRRPRVGPAGCRRPGGARERQIDRVVGQMAQLDPLAQPLGLRRGLLAVPRRPRAMGAGRLARTAGARSAPPTWGAASASVEVGRGVGTLMQRSLAGGLANATAALAYQRDGPMCCWA
jgi:hypothetical protein